MNLTAQLGALGTVISQICAMSGIAGMSLGVLYEGEIVHYANFGYRDVSARIPPDEDTIYVVGSLSKAFTSAMMGILVEQGDLDWETQVRHILPGYQRDERDSACNATISDILSHRTGVLGPDGYWLLSEGEVAFPRDQFVPVFNTLPTVQPTRTAFIYNNYAYELLGQIIERVSGKPFGRFLRESIMEPLGMTRTFDTRIPHNTKNVAKPYASLRNRTTYELGMPLVRQDGVFSAAGGLRTSVSDLLKFYKALIDAGMTELSAGTGEEQTPGKNPLRQLRAIWTGMISLPFPTLREHSYALGWVRAQLPSTFGIDGPAPWKAIIGKNSSRPLTIYHQGIIQGFTSFSVMIPETRSAVVVLANSGGLNEAGLLVASAVLETLLGEEISEQEYGDLANTGYEEAASSLSQIMQELEDSSQADVSARPLDVYTGRYYNSLNNYFIDIWKGSDGDLVISFMGKSADSFKLKPYASDTFFWYLTHDACVSRGRLPAFPPDYYVIKFAFGGKDTTMKDAVLYWKYDPDYPGDGEPFRRVRSHGTYGLRDNFQRSHF